MLNDQQIILPQNEPQRSPAFVQKQPLEVFCKKRCSEKFCKFHRKTSVLESLFNRVKFVLNTMKFAKFLRTPILKNISERLLLLFSPQNTIVLDRVQGKYFFKHNNLKSNAAILFIYKLKNVSLPFQLTFLLHF